MRNNQNRINDLKSLSNIIGIEFNDLSLIDIALTHRSFINENTENVDTHNERLEFLGDAILELVVSEYLYKNFQDRTEGELTSFRAAAVRTESLAKEARKLQFGKYLQMAKGEELTGGRDKDYLLANSFEAVIGAIYLDKDNSTAAEFISKHILCKIPEIVEKRLDIDNKSKFQEVAQSKYKRTPHYMVLKQEGPDHEKIFTVGVFVDDKQFGVGNGLSKQKAEEEAAANAITNLKK